MHLEIAKKLLEGSNVELGLLAIHIAPIQQLHIHLITQIYTPNMNLNYLITPCKPLACSNTTTHHKINHKHHKYRVLTSIEIK